MAISDVTNTPPSLPPSAVVPGPRTAQFKPEIAAIVGVLTTIFSVTFLVLLYVRHCKRTTTYANNSSRGFPPSRRNSGIERRVIESLPMFRFSSLRGHKDGLECAVCLNTFEPDEVLRLLPSCKHAFHVECVDTWLDEHSTCPLCRHRVHAEDVLLIATDYNHHSDRFTPRSSDHHGRELGVSRVSGRHSSAGENGKSSLGIIAEYPGGLAPDFRGRISLDSWKSGRKMGFGNESRRDGNLAGNQGRKSKSAPRKDGQLPVAQGERRRLEHRIIVSAAEEEKEGQRRWSDVQAAELLYLGSEKLLVEGESGNGVIKGRSVSEITGMSRYRSNNGGGEGQGQEEGAVKRWLAWISQSQQPAVLSATSPANSAIVVV